jgi:hypothetical protein
MPEARIEALIEAGIGETRALVLRDGAVAEVHIERDDDALRAGDLWTARLVKQLVAGRRGIVLAGDAEALLEPLPAGLAEGGLVRIEITRAAIPEAGRPRLAKAAPRAGAMRGPGRVAHGPDLAARLAARGLKVTPVGITTPGGHGVDRLEDAGWSEAVEAAMTGHVPFDGGLLTISPTPAMTVIDVDGAADPATLALAAATAAADAIARYDITGSIGVDFPTVADKAVRTRIGELLDAGLPRPFERTAVNGFGFVQIVRPRLRASVVELLRGTPVATAALALLRTAERASGAGVRVLTAAPPVTAWLGARGDLMAELDRRTGSPSRLQADAGLAISAGHVAVLA